MPEISPRVTVVEMFAFLQQVALKLNCPVYAGSLTITILKGVSGNFNLVRKIPSLLLIADVLLPLGTSSTLPVITTFSVSAYVAALALGSVGLVEGLDTRSIGVRIERVAS